MLIKTGVPEGSDINTVKPSSKRLSEGPVAILECFQEIPCNPCATFCPTNAITFDNINSLPKLDESKCTGCSICVSVCPGLAIFVIDETYSDKEAIIKIPYEYLPIPDVDSTVNVTDRTGKIVGTGRILKVSNINKKDRSIVISIVIPKELSMIVRGFKQIKEQSKG